jgi:hypothetical protein
MSKQCGIDYFRNIGSDDQRPPAWAPGPARSAWQFIRLLSTIVRTESQLTGIVCMEK